MTTTIDNKEYKLIEFSIPKKGLMKFGLSLGIADGIYHVLEGMGVFTPIPGAAGMPMSEFVTATQAIAVNWFAIAWGLALIISCVMIWRYINNN